jgi:hypothetical protein
MDDLDRDIIHRAAVWTAFHESGRTDDDIPIELATWEAAACLARTHARTLAAEVEVKRLQGIIEGLAARVAGQSELLSKRAEAAS